jgi:hypothetical protein
LSKLTRKKAARILGAARVEPLRWANPSAMPNTGARPSGAIVSVKRRAARNAVMSTSGILHRDFWTASVAPYASRPVGKIPAQGFNPRRGNLASAYLGSFTTYSRRVNHELAQFDR